MGFSGEAAYLRPLSEGEGHEVARGSLSVHSIIHSIIDSFHSVPFTIIQNVIETLH